MKTTGLSRAACLMIAAALTAMPIAEAVAQHRGYRGGGYRGGYGYHGGYRGGYGYRGGRGGSFVGGALLGLGVGALVGGAVARPYYRPPPPVYYAPPPPVVYAPPPGAYYPY